MTNAEMTNGLPESYRQLTLTLDNFSNALMRNLQLFIEVGDSSGIETIWTCCVTCLGHLAALSYLISQREPTLRGSMDSLCDWTLAKLGDLSRKVRVELYLYFDILTKVHILVVFPWMRKTLTRGADQVSWKTALDTIDLCIGLRPHTESKSLRYWRGLIWKVHVDFQANLLKCRPSPLMSLALSVDGRTEDSEFPNLLPRSGREPYGL